MGKFSTGMRTLGNNIEFAKALYEPRRNESLIHFIDISNAPDANHFRFVREKISQQERSNAKWCATINSLPRSFHFTPRQCVMKLMCILSELSLTSIRLQLIEWWFRSDHSNLHDFLANSVDFSFNHKLHIRFIVFAAPFPKDWFAFRRAALFSRAFNLASITRLPRFKRSRGCVTGRVAPQTLAIRRPQLFSPLFAFSFISDRIAPCIIHFYFLRW